QQEVTPFFHFHETRDGSYVAELRAGGLEVVDLREIEGDTALERTAAAMREGAGVVVQAALADGRWSGRADVLLRVDRSSNLGAWSYEVVDTKLARQTRCCTAGCQSSGRAGSSPSAWTTTRPASTATRAACAARP
ncbi:MAG TPA: hypothetical protein VEK15_06420, partial [Vicinamibacteria bacterium]|nr:hypothetical protein [Vicinamibacteria bacterium]